LAKMIDLVECDRPKVLNLLRGFFYWLTNLSHHGAFQPWLDSSSLKMVPQVSASDSKQYKKAFQAMSSFGSATPRNEERRGKVAALLKQQGVGVKDMTKSVPLNKEVWCIDGSAQTLLPKEDFGKSYSGDCYIVRYTYPAGDREKGYFECCWFGKDSIEEDQKTAYKFSERMFNSCKGRGVQGRIFQGEEPPQFVKLFQPMVVLKGGLSSGYKKFITDKGLTDETYKADSAARSLNSMDCFFLQSGSSIFTWHGKQCTFEQQHLAAKVAEFLKELLCNMLMKEKRANPSGVPLEANKVTPAKKLLRRDPHLFKYSFNKGIIPPIPPCPLSILTLLILIIFVVTVDPPRKFSEEVDDLFTEDILILNTHAEVFVWVGQSVESQRKKAAFKIGQKYIEVAASSEQFAGSLFRPNMRDTREILCQLPIKELHQCLCLSKECDQFGLLVEIDRPHIVHDDSSIIACCDGLVLFRNTNELFIWNMLIRRCWNISVFELPVKKLGDYSVRFYFGHDLTGDHKMLMADLLSETFMVSTPSDKHVPDEQLICVPNQHKTIATGNDTAIIVYIVWTVDFD
ncbi:villin-2 isoform X4, partial [Fagus crenata]